MHSSEFNIPQVEIAKSVAQFSKNDKQIVKEDVSQTEENLEDSGDLKTGDLDQHQILSRDIQIVTGKIHDISSDIRTNKQKLSEVSNNIFSFLFAFFCALF